MTEEKVVLCFPRRAGRTTATEIRMLLWLNEAFIGARLAWAHPKFTAGFEKISLDSVKITNQPRGEK